MQNVSFKSKINFIPSEGFPDIKRSASFLEVPEDIHVQTKKSDIFADCICDCTALFLVGKERIVHAFHFFNNEDTSSENLEKTLDKQLEKYKIYKGLIIGGKKLKHRPDSLKVFQRVLDKVKKFSPDISVFKNQGRHGITDVHYSPQEDTYNIQSDYGPSLKTLASVEELIQAFKEISVAPQDELYINGKLVSKNEHPKLFRK